MPGQLRQTRNQSLNRSGISPGSCEPVPANSTETGHLRAWVRRDRDGWCPVTVDLPFCQWILLVRRVLPPKFARFGIILRVMSVAEAAERVEPTRTRSYLPRRLHKPPL